MIEEIRQNIVLLTLDKRGTLFYLGVSIFTSITISVWKETNSFFVFIPSKKKKDNFIVTTEVALFEA